MKHSTWRAALLSAAAASLLGGCVSTPSEPPLEVAVTNLRLVDATVFETTAVVSVRYDNLTAAPLRVTGASHKLTVNGLRLGRALASDGMEIPRLGSATHDVEVHLRNLALARLLHELGQARTATYTLDGTIYVAGSHTADRRVHIQRAGELNLDSLRAATPAR